MQLYYDAGYGPSMLRLQVDRRPTGHARGTTAKVSVSHRPDDCERDTQVRATWADGTSVELDVAACLAFDGRANPPAKPQLSEAEAAIVVTDPRWGVTMDAALVDRPATGIPTVLPVYRR